MHFEFCNYSYDFGKQAKCSVRMSRSFNRYNNA